MKSKLFLIVAVVLTVILGITVSMVGCKATTTETTAAETTVAETTTAETTATEATTAATTASEVTGTFSITAFEGGFGVDWIKEAIKVFSAKYPKVTVNFTYDPKTAEELAPLFVAGTPPDVCMPGHLFDLWGAIREGQIKPLEKYLNDSNAIDKDIKWIDTFEKGTFAAQSTEDHIWYTPMFSNSNGWWYNKTVWDKNGWTPPKTWDEAYTLFDAMKKAGVGPIANQGIYPIYIRYIYARIHSEVCRTKKTGGLL
ncbi:MAG: extracellular solute-binding protein [Actinobacteria bacterium]|nr:extracellular solute-binding protein [Actinomycetota bacterium]